MAAFAILSTASAQDRAGPSLLETARGVVRDGAVVRGIGPVYRVAVAGGRFEFTPALGASAPSALPLGLTLGAVGRGVSRTPVPPPESPPHAEGHAIAIAHPGFVEHYELRPDGVEQSFTFARLPDGDGDLWVELRIDTPLPEPRESDGGLEFVVPGLGGVRVGGVIGIDARGARVAGSLRVVDDVLELRLPASFVARAALPLVLDPLIGAIITLASGNEETSPAVATLGARHLVVWQRRFAGGDSDIRAQMVIGGALTGSAILVRVGSTWNSIAPAVAVNRQRNRFVVAWAERPSSGSTFQIVAASVDINGSVGTPTQVVASTDTFGTPGLGGDLHDLGDAVVIVFHNQTQGRMEVARLTIGATGSLSASGRRVLGGSGLFAAPAIAPDGGADGRYLIAWQKIQAVPAGLETFIVDRFLNTLAHPVVPLTGFSHDVPAIAGDGRHWLCAYSKRPTSTALRDVACVWVTYGPAAGQSYLSGEIVVAGGGNEETQPAVAWLANSALIAYTNRGALGDFAQVRTLDWFSCVPCEPLQNVASVPASGDMIDLAVSASLDDALLVFESRDAVSHLGLRAQGFAGLAGSAKTLAPGCGQGGTAYTSCARAGHAGFALRLEHAAPGRPAFLMLQRAAPTNPSGLFCGAPCLLYIDPFRDLVVPVGNTDAFGNAAVQVAVPTPVVPVGFVLQWAVLPTSGAICTPFAADFSSAVRFSFSQ
jgi:hypothetical protein